jgi:hypothetical protein
MEPSTFTYILNIKNKLANEIAYCYDFEGEHCRRIIYSNGSEDEIYLSHGTKSSDEEMYEAFYRKGIRVCKKIINLKHIHSVSPIIKHDEYHFEVVIDKRVTDAFC